MTRRLGFLLAAALLALTPVPAWAQRIGPFNQLGGPSPVSTQVSNTATNTNIASYTIPPGYLTSGRAHLKILGNLSTVNSAPGTWTITAIVCGTSVTAVNAQTLDSGLSSAPFSFDVWLSPYGPAGGQFTYFFSEWRNMATSSTETIRRTVSRVACDTTNPESLTVQFQFGTAAVGTGIQIEAPVFSMGQ